MAAIAVQPPPVDMLHGKGIRAMDSWATDGLVEAVGSQPAGRRQRGGATASGGAGGHDVMGSGGVGDGGGNTI